MNDFVVKNDVVADDSGYAGETLNNPRPDDSYL